MFVCLLEPWRNSEYFPCFVQEAHEETSFAYDQSGAEEDGSSCTHESGDVPYTAEEESELYRDQSENQPEPGVQREIVESKISKVKQRLAPGEKLENYCEWLPKTLHGLCIISRLVLTCDAGSGTYPFQGPVEEMNKVELLIAWLDV